MKATSYTSKLTTKELFDNLNKNIERLLWYKAGFFLFVGWELGRFVWSLIK